MADDIVSTVSLEGVSKVESDFDSIAKAGEDAMARISASTQPANKDIQAVGQYVEAAARRFGASIADTTKAGGEFVSNVGRMVSAVVSFGAKIGVGIAAISAFSKATEQTSEATQQAIKLNKLQGREWEAAADRADNYARSQKDLLDSFTSGKIGVMDYAKQLGELKKKQQEDEEQARRQEARRRLEEEERIRLEAIIKRQAAAQQAYNDAVKTYGSEGASALMRLTPVWDQFWQKFNQGSSLASQVFDGLNRLLSQYGDEIIATFTRIVNSISELFGGKGKDSAQTFADAVMTAFRGVAFAIENILIPAFKVVATLLQPIASLINTVFGTEVTGAVLAVAAALVVFSGAAKFAVSGIMLIINATKLLRVALVAMGAGAWANPIIVIIYAIIAAILLLIIYWDDVKPVVMAVVNAIVEYWNFWKQAFLQGIQAMQQAWNDFWKWVSDGWNSLVQFLSDGWNAIQQALSWDNLVKLASDAWESIKKMAGEAWEWMKEAAVNAMAAIANAILDAVPGLRTFVELLMQAINYAKQLMSAGGGEGGPPAMARGGPIFGPGTSTSDSIPIWASVGEFMMQSRAVQYYGRSFMAALNAMRLPRDFDFSSALVVPAPRAGFATGGEVTRDAGGRPVILQFPDGHSFALTAANETADRLGRYAMSRRLSSAGRKPSYYGAV